MTTETEGPALWHGLEINSCVRCKWLKSKLVKSAKRPDYEFYCQHPNEAEIKDSGEFISNDSYGPETPDWCPVTKKMNQCQPINCTSEELSTFLQVVAAGCSLTNSSTTPQSAPSKSIPIASKVYISGKKTVTFHGFPSLTTFELSTVRCGAASLMSSAAASLARISAPPDREPGLPGLEVDSGSKCGELLARFDPATCSWKTVPSSPSEGEPSLLPALPPWGMTVGGELYRLPTPSGLEELRSLITSESASSCVGSFPTPNVPNGGPNQRDSSGRPVLQLVATRMPTATTRDWKDTMGMAKTGINPDGSVRKREDRLACAVYSSVQRLYTPTTPRPHDNENSAGKHIASQNQPSLAGQIAPFGGQLNPDWVEWFMGWPVGWTSLAQLPPTDNWLETFSWSSEPDGVPRVCGKMPDRKARLKAIGNGQVPHQVVLAWHLLQNNPCIALASCSL